MNSVSNSPVEQSIYKADENISLPAELRSAVCVLFPRALLLAGFNNYGQVLAIHYYRHNEQFSPWLVDFYEKIFIDDSLLSDPSKMLSVFIAADKTIIVPNEYYDTAEAQNWMNSIHFIEQNEQTETAGLLQAEANYLYAFPQSIKELLKRRFASVKKQPLAAYQFRNPLKTGAMLQCCISERSVFATLHSQGNIEWHQVFEYETAEDIAYQFHLLCKEKNIDVATLTLKCYMTHDELSPLFSNLARYFPHMDNYDFEETRKDNPWASSLSLLQQLYACAL